MDDAGKEREDYYLDMMGLYRYTERQFLEFDEIVPMITNQHSINSPKLYFLLLTTCGQIESVMNKICENLYGISEEEFKFYKSYKKLNENKVLDHLSVKVMKTNCICRPFVDTSRPFSKPGSFFSKPRHKLEINWWESYNDAKHKIPTGMKHGTISNTVSALAALYLLLNFFISIPSKESKSILKLDRWRLNVEPWYIESSHLIPNIITKNSNSNLFALKQFFRR